MSHSTIEFRRRPARLAAASGAVVMLALLGLAAFAPSAHAADKPAQQISRAIAKEMTAAQKAMQASQWSEALKDLDEAEGKSGINAFDKFKIHDFKGFAEFRLNKYKEAEADYEAALASGEYSAEEAAKTTKLLFRVTAQNQQYAKALEYGKQVADSPTVTPDDLSIMAQLYYLQKDCKNTVVWADKAVAGSKKAGEAPKEKIYQFKLQCASDAGDTPAMAAALYDLIRLTNKTSYWNTLIRIERQDERDDHNTLMIYRIMYDTGSMNADTDYIEMAQLLGDASLPGEAEAVLEKAMSSGVMKDEHKERTTRLLNALKARADTDKKSLPNLDAEASKNPAGQLDTKLGEVYFGAGDYQGAVTALNRGIGKGSIKALDEAYVYLGRSQAALKDYPDAKKAFQSLKTVPNISARVLKLYELYADKVGQPFT